jgi:hypothetical protein
MDCKNKVESIYCICTTGQEKFSPCIVSKTDMQPPQMGLVATNKCTLVLQTSKKDIKGARATNIVLKPIEYPLLGTSTYQSIRKESKKIKADLEEVRMAQDRELVSDACK